MVKLRSQKRDPGLILTEESGKTQIASPVQERVQGPLRFSGNIHSVKWLPQR